MWHSNIDRYSDFEAAVSRDPAKIFLTNVPTRPTKALTLATLIEEYGWVWVSGPSGWRAEVFRESSCERPEEDLLFRGWSPIRLVRHR